jgi:hypothetical protein
MIVLAYPAMAGDAPPEADAGIVRQAALEKRVMAKWDALIRRDFAAAYSLTSPAYRALYSLDAFKRSFGGQVAWQRINVVDVKFKGDNAALVGINLHFVYHRELDGQLLDLASYVQESWVQVDGQWWSLVKE